MKRYLVVLLLVLGGLLPALAGPDEGYWLAAQDKIAVTVLKHPELSGAYTVPPDGMIDFPRVGQVNVIGKTTGQVAAIIIEKLGTILVKPDVSVVLTEQRLRNANVLGSVAKPGPYLLTRGARITELVAAAGDLTGDRERLTATLIRGTRTLKVDLQQAIAGNPEANLELQEGDVLWIQAPALMTVIITGQVKTPGSYRLEQGSRLLDALAKAGDLLGEREKLSATVMRANATVAMDLQQALAGDAAANTQLQDGDLLMIQLPPMYTIVVAGPVKTPGPLKVEKGSRVLDAVAAAGDLVGSRDKMTAKILRGTATIPVMLQVALTGDREANLLLEDGDTLVIQAPPQITVTVMGQVKAPGNVVLDEGSTLVNAVTAAGDVTERPERVKVKLIRGGQVTEVKYGDNTVVVQDKDVVSIEREATVRVYVSGHVKTPGAYDVVEGGGAWAAITMAGGPLETPALGQVAIKRGGKTAQRVNLSTVAKGDVAEDPALQNGDEVIVPLSTANIVVMGAVARTGVFPISETDPVTVVDAIGLAGGTVTNAKIKEVVVLRDIDPVKGKATRIKVNLDEIIGKGRIEKNIVLNPKDVVYVPQGGLNPQWLDILRTAAVFIGLGF
ncbi:MAG: SLBB domain-containing protein [Armatimonadota bacterium]